MTSGNEEQAIPSDVLLERLVDGELDEARRRALLVRLEHEPDGWRHCAWPFWKPSALSRRWVDGGGRWAARPACPVPSWLTPDWTMLSHRRPALREALRLAGFPGGVGHGWLG